MVDEYLLHCVQPGLLKPFRFLYGRWIRPNHTPQLLGGQVQIPLWSMNTPDHIFLLRIFWSSDSSMVDEYYQLWDVKQCLKSGSDSSMVDEYSSAISINSFIFRFRFLYGRGIQNSNCYTSNRQHRFRFLYGRWIPRRAVPSHPSWSVQIPLWSMNTPRSGAPRGE